VPGYPLAQRAKSCLFAPVAAATTDISPIPVGADSEQKRSPEPHITVQEQTHVPVLYCVSHILAYFFLFDVRRMAENIPHPTRSEQSFYNTAAKAPSSIYGSEQSFYNTAAHSDIVS
jgi:hypothetical protein